MRGSIFKCLLLVVALVGLSSRSVSQTIEFDIFDNLIYKSLNQDYSAKLEQNIFDDLIFTDSKSNKITFKQKYINLSFGDAFQSKEAKVNLFRKMILEHRYDSNYVATYSVDIFDKVIIEDNRGGKVEIGKDIFGNQYNEIIIDGHRSAIKRNMRGGIDYYDYNQRKATLSKDIYDYWLYEDVFENELRISPTTWQRLVRRYGSEENVFEFLIYEFLFD